MSLSLKHFVFHPYSVNCYVISEPQGHCYIVDPACYNERERLQLVNYIKQEQLTPLAIINTHQHLDHNTSNVYMKTFFDIPVWGHAGDEFMLTEDSYLSARRESIPDHGLGKIDEYLSDDQLLPLGEEALRVIHTPGHSPGSICLYSEKGGWVISGDTLFCRSIGRSDLPRGNQRVLLRSIAERLFILPDATRVLPGHDEETSIGEEKLENPFF